MVRNDRWIKQMAHKGMIEPFEEGIIKEGVISYGVSSYGYDMRIADEFRIFTNINNTVVDPKNFDPKSFVEFKGSVCIIPPNSFALARSVEYFRIPRDVLVICIGKSTYARCGIIVNVTPLEPCYDKETEILTKEGWKKFEELRGDEEVATLNKDGILEYQRIEKMQKFKFKGNMIHITGRYIDLVVTPTHLMYVKDRNKGYYEFITAEKIYGKSNYEIKRDCLWLCSDREFFELPTTLETDLIRQTILNNLDGQYVDTETLYKSCSVRISQKEFYYCLQRLTYEGFIERRCTTKTINNRRTKVWEWKKMNYQPYWKIKMDDWLRFFGLWLTKGQVHKGKSVRILCPENKKETVRQCIVSLPFNFIEKDRYFEILNKQLIDYLMQFGSLSQRFIPSDFKELSSRQIKILLETFLFANENKKTNIIKTSSKRLADDLQELILKAGWSCIIKAYDKFYNIAISKKNSSVTIHKTNFSRVHYDDYVYDVTVANHTLYVRRNGKACWSSNCWEGYLTIEISNTTPLPAKIYANEGIAQLIFLKAEEECEVSYADRKGKYQAQQGIVLPKI